MISFYNKIWFQLIFMFLFHIVLFTAVCFEVTFKNKPLRNKHFMFESLSMLAVDAFMFKLFTLTRIVSALLFFSVNANFQLNIH